MKLLKTLITILLATTSILGVLLLNELSKQKEGLDPNTFKSTLTVDSIVDRDYSDFEVTEEVYEEPVEVVEEEIEINKFEEKFNNDYLGSISIPSIGTEDSIYKSEGEYYLKHNYNKEWYEPGEIYLDDRTGDSLVDNGALLNGHAVPNGTKFGNFKKLLNIEEQPKVYIYDHTLDMVVTYKMLFVSLIDGDNSGIIMNFPNEEMRIDYYKNLYSTSIKKWEEPTEGEYLLLNSCSYIIESGRYVVIAKKEI